MGGLSALLDHFGDMVGVENISGRVEYRENIYFNQPGISGGFNWRRPVNQGSVRAELG